MSLSGNVGIGSSIPISKLDVTGEINSSNYLIQQQNISNIFISSNVFDNKSNLLYLNLSNQDFISSSIKITSSQWSNATNNTDIFYNLGNIGIGTSIPSYSLDVSGNINSSHYLINQINISNIFTTSNVVDNKSNICISYVDSKVANLVSSQWATSNDNIYLNKSGNVGIGSSIPTEKLDIIGNLLISGDIYPSQTSNYDLGSSNYKWRDLYLSGNSIYLDNMIVYKNGNSIEIKDSNLNADNMGININQISIYSNNQLSQILLDNNGTIFINSNGTNKYPVNLNNNYDYSNIIYSNILLQQSNNLYSFTNTSLNSINTDTIPIGTSNRFITNDIYNANLTINGILNTSNLITSNLSVIGDSTTLNTTVYQTEQLQIVNDTTATSLIVRQVNTNNNVAEFYFNNTNSGLVINKSGNIGIGSAIPQSNLDINGNVNINNGGSLVISGVNINTNITSNTNYSSNNLYANISNLDFISSNNNAVFISNNSNTIFSQKQNVLTASTNLLGNGSSITNINYNNISTNKPDLSVYATISGLTSTSNDLYTNLSNQDFRSSNTLISYTNTQISGITSTSNQWITSNTSFYYFNSNKNVTITSTTSNYVLSSSSAIVINNGTATTINAGTYNIVFTNGGVNINIGTAAPVINDKSYPIVSSGNLIAWYKFDDNTINMLLDSSGNNYNLTNNNSAFNSSVYIRGNGSIYFNGNSSVLINSFNFNINNTNFSICYWQYVSSSSRIVFSIGEGYDFAAIWFGYNLIISSSVFTNRYAFGIYGSDNLTSSSTFNDFNTWVHICYTYSFSGTSSTRNIYRNGVLVANVTNATRRINIPLPAKFQIGDMFTPPGEGPYKSTGSIDDFRIYNKELSAAEISQLYNGGSVGIYTLNQFSERVGIGTNVPNYALDIIGELNTNELLLNTANISNLFVTSNVFENRSNNVYTSISNLDFITSNNSISFTNSKFSSIGNINPWITSGNNIYYNQGNIGIGTTNPLNALDISGDLNINGEMRISNVLLPFTTFSNTNIVSSNGSFNYINNCNTFEWFI